MVWGLKECLDDLQIKNLELIKDVGAEMAVPKKGEFMSQPHVEASGKRILTRERRDRSGRRKQCWKKKRIWQLSERQ